MIFFYRCCVVLSGRCSFFCGGRRVDVVPFFGSDDATGTCGGSGGGAVGCGVDVGGGAGGVLCWQL